jgi:hypothetical protein
MSSERKIESNRINAKKSTGPKTTRGKSRASGNAWQHGWAVIKRSDPSLLADVERMATGICPQDASPALYEQAIIIAECQIFLIKLRAACAALGEEKRIIGLPREPAEQGILGSLWPSSDQPRPDATLVAQAAHAMRDLQAKLAQAEGRGLAGNEQLSAAAIGSGNGDEATRPYQPSLARHDGMDALLRALPERDTLERYERRALSRRNQAIRRFEAISVVSAFLRGQTEGT